MQAQAERFECPVCHAELRVTQTQVLQDCDGILNDASSTNYTCTGCGGAYHRMLIRFYPQDREYWKRIEQDRHVPLDTGHTPRLVP